jgi:hypothetical protein
MASTTFRSTSASVADNARGTGPPLRMAVMNAESSRGTPENGQNVCSPVWNRVDGVEVDAAIQDERAVNLISTLMLAVDVDGVAENSCSHSLRANHRRRALVAVDDELEALGGLGME